MSSPRPLRGKVAVVTGGARGIGRATAQKMVRVGIRVAIGDLDQSLAEQAAASLGPGARGYGLDVSDLESFEVFLNAVARDLGPIDILINNAGIMPLGAFAHETPASTERQVGVNVFGVCNGCRLAIPTLSRRQGAHIVNVASAAAKSGYGGVATYCGTKHFVLGFSEGLRSEVAPLGIEVSCILPSVVNTELSSGMKSMPGFEAIDPSDVADTIVAILERPRFEVFVPRALGPIQRAMLLMPRRVKDLALRKTGTDVAALSPDWVARAAYEQRVVGSASTEQDGSIGATMPDER